MVDGTYGGVNYGEGGRAVLGSPSIQIGTLNLRNTADRWRQRRPLLVSQLLRLAPDLIGFQEVRRFPNQAAGIARAVHTQMAQGHAGYQLHCTSKTGLWKFWEAIAVLSRLPIVERGSLALPGEHRVAQRVLVQLAEGAVLDVYNVHLAVGGEDRRQSQMEQVLTWMGERAKHPQVLVGDLNCSSQTPTIRLIKDKRGLRSAYAVARGTEPLRTFSTPLRPMESEAGGVIDYIFVSDHVDVHDAQVVFDEVSVDDPHLVASDHYGIAASISVR